MSVCHCRTPHKNIISLHALCNQSVLPKSSLMCTPLQAQISPSINSYINNQTVHARIYHQSLSVCFYCGWFLRHVRYPWMLEFSIFGYAGHWWKATWLSDTTWLDIDIAYKFGVATKAQMRPIWRWDFLTCSAWNKAKIC